MFLLSHQATRPAFYSSSSTIFLTVVSQRTAAVPAELAHADQQLLIFCWKSLPAQQVSKGETCPHLCHCNRQSGILLKSGLVSGSINVRLAKWLKEMLNIHYLLPFQGTELWTVALLTVAVGFTQGLPLESKAQQPHRRGGIIHGTLSTNIIFCTSTVLFQEVKTSHQIQIHLYAQWSAASKDSFSSGWKYLKPYPNHLRIQYSLNLEYKVMRKIG